MMKKNGIVNSQLEQTTSSTSLEGHVLQLARGDPGAVHRTSQRHTVLREFPVLPQGLPYST